MTAALIKVRHQPRLVALWIAAFGASLVIEVIGKALVERPFAATNTFLGTSIIQGSFPQPRPGGGDGSGDDDCPHGVSGTENLNYSAWHNSPAAPYSNLIASQCASAGNFWRLGWASGTRPDCALAQIENEKGCRDRS